MKNYANINIKLVYICQIVVKHIFQRLCNKLLSYYDEISQPI